jgi:hypothetical protein
VFWTTDNGAWSDVHPTLAVAPFRAKEQETKENVMLLLIIVLILLFGGGGGYYGYSNYGPAGGIAPIILVVLVIWLLLGRGGI